MLIHTMNTATFTGKRQYSIAPYLSLDNGAAL